MTRRPARAVAGALAAAVALSAGVAVPLADDAGAVRRDVFRKLSEGVRLLRTGDARGAAENLCWAAERALNSHEAAWLCGRALIASRDPLGAVRHLELAASLDPRHLGTRIALGDAYLADGQLDRARAAYFSALEIRNDHSPAYDGLARLAWQTGNEERALELYGKALEANSADAIARLNRGALHLEAGRTALALRDIREAARLRPDDGEVQLGLARVLLSSGLENDALSAARRAREIRPGDARPYALEALVLLETGDFGEAEKAARAAIERDEDAVDARIALGEVLGRTGRLDDAVAALVAPRPELWTERELAKIDERRASWDARRERLTRLERVADDGEAPAAALLALARTRLETGSTDRAVTLARRAAERGGLSPDELRHAAYVLGRAGKALEAEQLLERIVAGGGALAEDWLQLGTARELSGDPAGAADAFERADGDAATRVAAGFGRARIALALGEPAAAIAHLERVRTLAEKGSEAALRATEALARLGVEVPDASLGAAPAGDDAAPAGETAIDGSGDVR